MKKENQTSNYSNLSDLTRRISGGFILCDGDVLSVFCSFSSFKEKWGG